MNIDLKIVATLKQKMDFSKKLPKRAKICPFDILHE